jgi:hypothetical protein
MNALSNLGLLASLIFPASANFANEGRTATLAQALETFNAVDSNKDGKLSPEEVAVFQLGRSDTRGVDVDRDESWSKDEFIVFYRQRLLAANVKPAADLEAEATRILAARKAKASERNTQPSLSEARRAAKQAQAQTQSPNALTGAVDELQVKASTGQAKGADFDRVRELLLADARAADSVAKGEDAALGEKSELHRKLLQSLERLRNAAAAGTFSREEYQDFRQAIVKRARNAANGAAAGQENPASPDVQAIEQGLNEALDRLEQRATAGNATREDFERVRDQLVARARAAANGANGPGAVEVELQSPAQRKMMQSLERLQTAAAAGSFSREEYRAFRESIVQRFRRAEVAGTPAAGADAESAAIEQGLTQALDQLEQRAAAGNASRADFQRVRDQLVARARAAANGTNGATTPEAELQGPVHRKLIQSLDRLEAAAQQGTYSREEYSQLRDSMIHRARAIQNPAQPSPVVSGGAPEEAGMTQAATDLERRVDGGQVTAADFQKLRGLIAAKAQAAGAKSDPESAKEALVYQKLMQSLDRLEKAAQNGSVDRQEFQAFKDSFIHRARQIASDSEPSSSSSSEQKSSEQNSADRGAAGKRSAAPVATPPGAQPLPADKGSAKRADPARDAGGKGDNNDPKPAPQPAPAERPKPAGQEPQTPPPQTPPQPPHRPASESGSGKPGG